MAYYSSVSSEHSHHAMSMLVDELRPWLSDIAAGLALLLFFTAAYWASACAAALIAN